MLERHEEEALAEIEARFRADDPDLSEALDAGVAPLRVHPLVRSVFVVVLAMALTAATTLVVGPDLGGFVAVIALSYAAMYTWQAFRVCRGTQQQHPRR